MLTFLDQVISFQDLLIEQKNQRILQKFMYKHTTVLVIVVKNWEIQWLTKGEYLNNCGLVI